MLDGEKAEKLKQRLKQIQNQIMGVFGRLIRFFNNCINCWEEEKDLSLTANTKDLTGKKRAAILAGSIFPGNPEMNSGLDFTHKMEKLKDLVPIVRTSLFLFGKDNSFRRLCWDLIYDRIWFEYVIFANVIVSLIILALDSPLTVSRTITLAIYYLDLITTVIFIIEVMLKFVAIGFLFNGSYSYMRNLFNVLELTSVVLSVTYIINNSYTVFDPDNQNKVNSANITFRIIKMFRIVRVFKIVSRFRTLQAAMSALLVSVKQMLNIILIGSVFIFIFAIIAVTYLRGLFFRCNFTNVPEIFMYEIKTKWDCLDYGGDWVNPYPNFDNIKSSFVLFFEMMTTENWTFYMYSAMDVTSINTQPILNNTYNWFIFFILYMIIAYFFLLNLSVPVLYDNFKIEKTQIENSNFKIPIQKELHKIYENLFKEEMPKKVIKKSKVTKILLNVLESIYFDVVITLCIIGNMCILLFAAPDMNQTDSTFLSQMSTLFSYIFICEAVFKIFVLGCSYFNVFWNVLDFVIVCETIFDMAIVEILSLSSSFLNSSIFRAVRVARILRLLKKAVSLNRIFNLFINSIPGMINITVLYFLLLFIYSIIGMSMFGHIRYQSVISSKWNFENFGNAVYLLIRITSGESWNIIMHECMRERDGTYFCKYYEEMTTYDLSGICFLFTFNSCEQWVRDNMGYPVFLFFLYLVKHDFLAFLCNNYFVRYH